MQDVHGRSPPISEYLEKKRTTLGSPCGPLSEINERKNERFKWEAILSSFMLWSLS